MKYRIHDVMMVNDVLLMVADLVRDGKAGESTLVLVPVGEKRGTDLIHAIRKELASLEGANEEDVWEPEERATEKQVAYIHRLKAEAGMSDEEYVEELARFGVQSSKQLTVQQASAFIEYLKGRASGPGNGSQSLGDRVRAKFGDEFSDGVVENLKVLYAKAGIPIEEAIAKAANPRQFVRVALKEAMGEQWIVGNCPKPPPSMSIRDLFALASKAAEVVAGAQSSLPAAS